MLAMCGRDLPTASAISCCVRPKRSIKRLEALRFFDRVEVRALHVFDDRDLEHFNFVELADHGRDRVQARALRRAPAAFAGDDLVFAVSNRTHQDRLQHAVRADRAGEFSSARLRRNACAAVADCVAPDRSAASAGRRRTRVGAAPRRRGAGDRSRAALAAAGAFVTGSSNTLRGGSIGARGAVQAAARLMRARWRASARRCAPVRRAARRGRGPVLVVSNRSYRPRLRPDPIRYA